MITLGLYISNVSNILGIGEILVTFRKFKAYHQVYMIHQMHHVEDTFKSECLFLSLGNTPHYSTFNFKGTSIDSTEKKRVMLPHKLVSACCIDTC